MRLFFLASLEEPSPRPSANCPARLFPAVALPCLPLYCPEMFFSPPPKPPFFTRAEPPSTPPPCSLWTVLTLTRGVSLEYCVLCSLVHAASVSVYTSYTCCVCARVHLKSPTRL